MKYQLRLKLIIGDTHIVIGDSRDGTPYRLLAAGLDGISGVESALQLSEYAQCDGAAVVSAGVPGREIGITFEIADYENREAYREALLSFFKPHTRGWLTVSRRGRGLSEAYERTIACMLWGNVRMTQESVYDYIRVSLTLYCPDPYFYAEQEPYVLSRYGAGLLTFPLTLTANTGMTAGVMTVGDRLTVNNTGDTETGFLINITASAAAPGGGAAFENPCITHAETGAYIRILDTLALGETLTVCTLPGAKYILKNGKRMMRFDRGSTFFALRPGINTLLLSAQAHLGMMEAALAFRTRHFGA